MVKKTNSEKTKERNPEKEILTKNLEMQKIIVENSINLQKVVVDLSVKFEKLSNQISDLLNLFEKSAKSFAEKQGITQKDKEFLDKIDKLMEQNKTIAKGLSLMEKNIKEKPSEEMEEEEEDMEIPIPKPLPTI